MKTGGSKVLLILITIMLVGAQYTYAQYNVQHQAPTLINADEVTQLEFLVPGVNPSDVQQAYLFYRSDGDLGYAQKEVQFQNGMFEVTLSPDELSGNAVEYYFQLTLNSLSQDVFYPDNVPSENPIKIELVQNSQDIPFVDDRKRAEGIDYTILSPKPGNGLAPNDAYVAIALYYDKEVIPTGSFKLFLNNLDVTSFADTSDYFISYVPKNLERGNYQVRVEYHTASEKLLVTEWEFRIVRPGQSEAVALGPSLRPSGRLELTARNQIISGNTNNAYTGRTSLSGSYGKFKYSLSGFLTSQESERLQPQNRYNARLSLGKWWKFEAGHIFPQLSKFTISGRRIEGINTSLHLLWENINVQFLYGELSRDITNIYNSIDEEFVYSDSTQTQVVDTTYTLSFENGGRGTFNRNVIGGRVALGNPRYIQLGVQALKVEDDTTSIFNVIDYNDVLLQPGALLNNLSIAGQQRLLESPDLLRVEGGGVRPKGNIVAGVDFRFAFDKNRIRFQTETVASALNNDIYGGPLTAQQAADLGFEDVEQKDLDILQDISQIIIVNENVNVLPLRLTGIGTDTTETEFFFPTSILGSNTEFSMVYPKNTFRLQYRWVGPDFVSLANSTIRKDIAGYTVSDRFRMFKNQVYVTLGYERLTDNVTDTKEATTVTSSIRSNLSWYPVNQSLPRISMGFRLRNRDNGVERFNPLVPSQLETAAIQNVRIASGDTLTTTTPRKNETLNLNVSITQQVELNSSIHDATISLASLNTTDEVFAFGDVQNSAYSFNLASRFSQTPLRTQLGVSYNQTESGAGQLNIEILGVTAGATYFMFDGALRINGRIAFTSNTSKSRTLQIENSEDESFLNDYYSLSATQNISEFNTYVFLAGAEYKLGDNHSLVFDSNFTNVSGSNGLNDRLVQLRYIYRF
jgi:hypothetical protein